ncbi:SDR family oxidoreductase [Paenibacillus sp. MMS20-IR301]|uniref:SDR family oxidoreductase n=1 Tax=Paenibacillus sp. MMS20-IR301 TaxID=2895946 RepID=UPI0028ED4EDD|nr:SDR family oxidoreductase [Paenibacillus sp. MMS20-IR301]WNS42453.1 SDR family oxidoreductase [Paenibacillus sp. MMS20-IR301]
MDLGLGGKSVFVAAASKGLGLATAMEYAREGAKVTIASRSLPQLEAARQAILEATGREVAVAEMDVTVPEDIARAVKLAAGYGGGLDVLVTNAGGPPGGSFGDMADADWSGGFELTLMSTVRLIREALPYLRAAAGGGRIVSISSVSIKQPIQGLILSNVFRAGVSALNKSLAAELAPEGILINSLAPGRIGTDRILQLDGKRAEASGVAVEQIQAEALKGIPLGRTGTPEEFGKAAVFLGSFANTYITGQSLLIDGGMVKSL